MTDAENADFGTGMKRDTRELDAIISDLMRASYHMQSGEPGRMDKIEEAHRELGEWLEERGRDV